MQKLFFDSNGVKLEFKKDNRKISKYLENSTLLNNSWVKQNKTKYNSRIRKLVQQGHRVKGQHKKGNHISIC